MPSVFMNIIEYAKVPIIFQIGPIETLKSSKRTLPL